MYMNVLNLLWILPIVGTVCFVAGAVLRVGSVEGDDEIATSGGEQEW